MTSAEYLEKPLLILFMEHFPVAETLFTEKIISEFTYHYFRGQQVAINVSLCRCTFGENNDSSIFCIVTDICDVVSKSLWNTFGTECHLDEAKAMELALTRFAEKHGLPLSRKECSWPFAKASVSIHNTRFWDANKHFFEPTRLAPETLAVRKKSETQKENLK